MISAKWSRPCFCSNFLVLDVYQLTRHDVGRQVFSRRLLSLPFGSFSFLSVIFTHCCAFVWLVALLLVTAFKHLADFTRVPLGEVHLKEPTQRAVQGTGLGDIRQAWFKEGRFDYSPLLLLLFSLQRQCLLSATHSISHLPCKIWLSLTYLSILVRLWPTTSSLQWSFDFCPISGPNLSHSLYCGPMTSIDIHSRGQPGKCRKLVFFSKYQGFICNII